LQVKTLQNVPRREGDINWKHFWKQKKGESVNGSMFSATAVMSAKKLGWLYYLNTADDVAHYTCFPFFVLCQTTNTKPTILVLFFTNLTYFLKSSLDSVHGYGAGKKKKRVERVEFSQLFSFFPYLSPLDIGGNRELLTRKLPS
jgi:hypothetical protein